MLRLCVYVLLVSYTLCQTDFNPLDVYRRDKASTRLDPSIMIKVNTSVLESSGSWVTVSWSGVSNSKKKDWIGVFSPPVNNSIDPATYAPVKYQYAKVSSTHKKGYGFFQFRLVNMRAPIIMGFLRGGFSNPSLAAVSNIVQFQNWNEPLQVHLALTGNPTVMIVTWVTRDAKSPEVKWGTRSAMYTHSTKANTSSYNASDMCGSPATDFGYRDPGLLHQAKLTGLQPDHRYYYVCGDDEFGWSQEFHFSASPLAGPSITTRVSAFGDMGNGQEDDSQQSTNTQPPALNTTRLLNYYLNETDLVLHVGDISYANGYASVWDDFFDQVQSVSANVPYMVCIGNHERDYPLSNGLFNITDSGGECGVPYEKRFPMPRPALDQPWYGFDYGSAHFVLMSTEHDFNISSPQYQFLDSHLKTVDRMKTPWLIFGGHRPMYVDSTSTKPPDGNQPVAEQLRKNVEPLFQEYKVDLALWGHHHAYQRTCPVYRQKCTDGGTVHILIGVGGHDLSSKDEVGNEPQLPCQRSDTPSWIEYRNHKHWGFTRITTNATTLAFEFIRDKDGKIEDTLVLKK